VLPRFPRAVALFAILCLTTLGLTAPSDAKPAKDPRRTQGLFVDNLMPAYQQGGTYRTEIGKRPQALWLSSDYYSRGQVAGVVKSYTARAKRAKKTPMLVVYSIPDRDCGGASQGGLPGAAAYKSWVRAVAKGLRGTKSLLVLEPDAIPFYGNADCQNASGRLGLIRYATKVLSKTGTWVYLDAGHSNWTPYDDRAALLKQAGIKFARGFSTNVSNFRPLADEKRYASTLISGLRGLGIKGTKYVVDTSRNGAQPSSDGNDVCNPPWARVGAKPRLAFKGAFDGTLWVKHPGESDGDYDPNRDCHGGPPSGQWSNALADGLLGR
jgi:endoglucanase